ncbi:MAG: sensor histidine kinase [Bacteroidetes bacterium]|nr:MAG: sensor histidine kinase [Bacteroidota bacterium]
MLPRKTVSIVLSLLIAGHIFSQRHLSPDEFDSIYHHALAIVNTDSLQASSDLNVLISFSGDLSPFQNAEIKFLRFQIIRSDKEKFTALENKMCSAPDSLDRIDSLLYSSEKYLERSMPDKAIPLLLQAIRMLPENSDKTAFCIINLCEAYREKQEYVKGISMLNELLTDKSSLSDENRAFAYNRLAALYNEWGYPRISYTDSVFKYSDLCITLSEKIDSKPNLAASQNELSFQFLRKKEYDKALDLSVKSVGNFIEAGKPFHAMNALINQSKIFFSKRDDASALRVIEEAMDMSGIEQNRNLYMRLYSQLATIHQLMGEYKEAFGLLQMGYQLQSDFFKDRIDRQINEQSAKYDLLTKEQKIKEEKEKNESRRRELLLLVIITVSLLVAFIVSLFYFRLKRQGAIRQKLIEAVAETETQERKRIARDLHDGLGPVLSAINHYFQAFLDAKPGEREAIQRRLQQVISDAIDEVSRISHNISPLLLENHGLITALNNFIAPLSKNSRITIRSISNLPERFDLKKELTVYRCITELLNNSMKHAGATQITVNITSREKMLYVSYSDNGKGFDPGLKKSAGMGLYNIQHRIESFGGMLVIESAPGKGVNVSIELPI